MKMYTQNEMNTFKERIKEMDTEKMLERIFMMEGNLLTNDRLNFELQAYEEELLSRENTQTEGASTDKLIDKLFNMQGSRFLSDSETETFNRVVEIILSRQ